MIPEVVVIVSDSPNYTGGAEKVAIDSAIGLSKAGIKTIFFASQHLDKDIFPEEIKIITTNQYSILSNASRINAMILGIWNAKSQKEFKRLLDTLSPDKTIIHFHSWTKSNSASLFKETSRQGFKIFITLHDYFLFCPNGGLYNYQENKICNLKPMSLKCILSNCDSRCYKHKMWRVIRQFVQNNTIQKNKNINYISISDLNHDVAKRHLDKASNIYKIGNPIDMLESSRIHQDRERKFYLYVGRISPEKGIDLFCDVMSQLNLPAIVIGDGENRKIYQQKYQNINFVGWKTKDEMIPYIEQTKALIFPSLWYEGAPLTTKEFRALGIPMIVSDTCAAKEDVINGITGYTFDSGNKNDLIKKIGEIENASWKNLSLATSSFFSKDVYTLDTYISNLLEVYKNALE